MSHEETNNIQVVPEDKEKTKKIWKVAAILAIVTIIEFIFAFTLTKRYYFSIYFLRLNSGKSILYCC